MGKRRSSPLYRFIFSNGNKNPGIPIKYLNNIGLPAGSGQHLAVPVPADVDDPEIVGDQPYFFPAAADDKAVHKVKFRA